MLQIYYEIDVFEFDDLNKNHKEEIKEAAKKEKRSDILLKKGKELFEYVSSNSKNKPFYALEKRNIQKVAEDLDTFNTVLQKNFKFTKDQ